MIRILIISIIFYVLPFLVNYFFNKKMHSKNGQWSYANAQLADFLFTVLPLINFIAMFFCFRDLLADKNFNKFFCIKK